MATDQLRDAVAAAPTWWAAATAAAQIWWDRPDAGLDYDDEPERWGAVAATVDAVLAGAGTPDHLGQVLAADRVEIASAGDQLAAHATAQAICDRHGRDFARWWADTVGDEHTPAAGEAIPIALRDPDALPPLSATHRMRPTARPTATEVDVDAFTHIRRAIPATAVGPNTVEVVYDFRAWDHLAPLDTGGIPDVALLHLNAARDELTATPSGPVKFGIRPRLPLAQARRLEQAVDAACTVGARLVVGAECTSHPIVTWSLEQRQRRSPHLLPITIPGSVHTEAPARPTNDAVLIASGERFFAHRKIIGVRSGPSTHGLWKEGNEPGSTVRIFVSGGLRLAVLICRDALESSLIDLLTHNGANLLCIPALSPRHDEFAMRLPSFALDSQGTVVLAGSSSVMTPEQEDDPFPPPGVIALPLQGHLPQPPSPGHPVERGMTILDGSTTALTWHPL